MEIQNNKYNNSFIYTIRSPHTNKFYIGSTTQILCRRFSNHKTDYNLYVNNGFKGFITSFKIIELGDSYIELLEQINCDSKIQLEMREGELIRIHKDLCINTNVAGRTREQYLFDNIDKIKQDNKHYRLDNADKIKQYYLENIDRIKEYNKQYHFDNTDNIIKFSIYLSEIDTNDKGALVYIENTHLNKKNFKNKDIKIFLGNPGDLLISHQSGFHKKTNQKNSISNYLVFNFIEK